MARKQNMLINNGVLYMAGELTDYKIATILAAITDENKLGLGKDSIKFEAKPVVTDYDFAGRFDRSMKGMQEINGWEVSLEGDLLDFNTKLMDLTLLEEKAEAGETNTDYKKYVPKAKLDDSTDYKNIILVGTVKDSDNPIVILVKRTFSQDGLQFELKDAENSAVSLVFKGSYDFDNDEDMPFEILIPTIK